MMTLDLDPCPEFISCGRFIAPEGWVHRRRTIDSYELVLGLEGRVWLEEGGRAYEVGPGDILFIRPGVVHGGWRPSTAGASFWWVHFNPRTGDHGVAVGAPRPGAMSFPLWIPGLSLDRARVIMAQVQDSRESPHADALLRDHLCASLLLEIRRALREREGPEGSGAEPWFQRLLAWARLKLHQPLRVSDLAAQAGRHPDYLARCFRRHLGLGPLQWLHRERLALAKRHLMEGDKSIKEIAALAGFGDARQFSRRFRTEEALSPTQWRLTYTRTHLNRD